MISYQYGSSYQSIICLFLFYTKAQPMQYFVGDFVYHLSFFLAT